MGIKMDGKALADKICLDLKARCDTLKSRNINPVLTIVTSGEDSASKVYVRNKVKRCEEIGIKADVRHFDYLTEADRKTIQYIVAGEAKGEPMEGKMAVAQCILHGMVKSDWSAERVRIEYQYSGWDDELENTNPEAWAEVVEAVSRVFDDGELISDKPILYFYAPKYSDGKWHKTLEFAFEISGHRFFYLDEDVNADWFLNLRKDV